MTLRAIVFVNWSLVYNLCISQGDPVPSNIFLTEHRCSDGHKEEKRKGCFQGHKSVLHYDALLD